MKKSLYQKMNERGLVTGNHQSDLYTKATPEAIALAVESGLSFGRFINQVTGEANLDIAFAYDPYWKAKEKKEVQHESKN